MSDTFEPEAVSDFERGMRAQLARLHEAHARGVPRIGWKLALTDPAVQQRMGLEAPAVGALDGAAVLESRDEYFIRAGAIVKVEAEIGIVIGRDVEGSESPDSARSAIAALTPALEVVDYSKPSESLEQILAHSSFHAAAAFGDEWPYADDLDLEVEGLAERWPRLLKNDQLARVPDGAIAPGKLEAVVAHVARTLENYGERLLEGDRILSGSFTQPIGVQPGDRVCAECGLLGEVHLRFER